MRYVLILLLFTGLSCKLISTTRNNISAPKEPVNDAKPIRQYSNREVWQRIVERPDSVSLSVQINDTVAALLTLSGRLDSAGYKPDTLTVKFSNDSVQGFQLTSSTMLWQKSQRHSFVSLQDLNFDGAADLLLFDNAGAVNFWSSVYLYNAEAGYSLNEGYTQTPSLKANLDKKLVMSFYRAGGCEEVIGYYKAVSDSLQPVSYLYTSQEGDSCLTYQKDLVKDVWRVTKLGEWDITLYDSLYSGK